MRQELKNAFGKVFITIVTDKANRWVHTNWVGYLTEENVKAGALAYTNAVREAGFSCVLNDTRQLVGGWDHSLDWVVNQWAPQAARAGVRHFAMITNQESFAASSAKNFISSINSFEVQIFENRPKAEAWLHQFSLTSK